MLSGLKMEPSIPAWSANSGPLSVRIRENAREKAFGIVFSSMSSAEVVEADVLSGISSASWNLNALRYNVKRHWWFDLSPITVSISQVAARSSFGNSINDANERVALCELDLADDVRVRGLDPHLRRKSRLLIPA